MKFSNFMQVLYSHDDALRPPLHRLDGVLLAFNSHLNLECFAETCRHISDLV